VCAKQNLLKMLKISHFLLLIATMLVFNNQWQQVEAGKGTKRMLAMLALTMLRGNKKIIIPFPIPMPVK